MSETLDQQADRVVEYRNDCHIAPRLVTIDGLTRSRHRELWRILRGPLRDGDRLVRTGPCPAPAWCVNPWHFTKTKGTVIARGRKPYQSNGRPDAAAINRAKTHCPKNHPLTPENVYVWTDSRGRVHRKCKRCTIRAAERRRSQR